MIALPGLEPHQVARLIPIRPVLVSYRGSITHGTHVPPEQNNGFDDIDLVVAYIPSGLEPFFGFERKLRGQDIKEGAYDCAAYDLRHFIQLLAGGNPNLVSLLWTDRKHIIDISWEGQALLEERSLFATKEAAQKFIYYAISQQERMLKWQSSPELYTTGYMGARRKALTEKYGYDCKNAAHAVRLLSMGEEFARTGELRVDRTGIDAQELIEIKTGDVPLQLVLDLLADLRRKAELALFMCRLPEKSDVKKIEDLCVDLHCYRQRGLAVLRGQDVLRRRAVWTKV